MLTRLLAAGVSLAALYGCVAEFHCSEDSSCDLKAGGRCVAGRCDYSGAATTGGPGSATDAATVPDPATSTGVAESEAPAGCEPWDVVLKDDRGKATGLALTADGAVLVAGVGVADGDPAAIAVRLLSASGEPGWRSELADTENATLDDDTSLWARPFLHDPAGDELMVVYTRRINNAELVPVETGPFIHHLAVADGGVRPVDDDVIAYYQAIRGVARPDADTLLFAGERKDNIWYQRATLSDEVWTATWGPVEPFAMTAGYYNTAITQAIAAVDAGVLVGGSWDEVVDQDIYSGWLRRLTATSGAVECSCKLPDVGVMAIAPAGDGSLVLTGLAQEGGQSKLWLGKLDPTCPLVCAAPDTSFAWAHKLAGAAPNTYYRRAELFEDAGFAIVSLAGGELVVGGALDGKPWVAGYSATGERRWVNERAAPGAVLALAVSPDERCLTIAGSHEYLDFTDRVWWVRRIALPG